MLRDKLRKFNICDAVVIVVSTIMFALLLMQNYPISGDDLIYRFDMRTAAGGEEWTTPITNFGQLLGSNVEGYLYGNGRFLVHCFVQLILSFGGYGILYVISPILFAVLLASCLYIIRYRTTQLKGEIIYVLTLLLGLYPLCATSMYGTVAMTVNYLWSAAIYSAFIAIYLHISHRTDDLRMGYKILLFLFGLLCGCWQESYCIGIAGAIALYHLIHIKQFKGNIAWLVIGFGIGAVILIFAPGNFVRVQDIGGGFIGVSQFIHDILQLFKHNFFVWLWIGVGVISVIIDAIKYRKIRFISTNWLGFLIATIALLFTIYTIAQGMMQGIWQLTVLSIIDTILVLRFIAEYGSSWINKVGKILVPCLGIGLLLLYIPIYASRVHVKNVRTEFVDAFVMQKPDTVYAGAWQACVVETMNEHRILFDKICPMYAGTPDLKTVHRMAHYFTSSAESWGTIVLPEPVDSILARCEETNRIGNCVYIASLQYMIIKNETANDSISRLVIHTIPVTITDKLKGIIKHNKVKDLEFTVSELQEIATRDNTTYRIKDIDWWTYKNWSIVGADIINE